MTVDHDSFFALRRVAYIGCLIREAKMGVLIVLAQSYSKIPIEERIAFFREIERDAIESEDDQFRFHSGIPADHLMRS